MTLNVTGVETIEITDPNGVCENQRQKARGSPAPSDPLPNDPLDVLRKRLPSMPGTYVPMPRTLPGTPTINPIPLPSHPWRRPLEPTIYEHHPKEKWQVGLTGDPPGAVPNMPNTAATGDPTQSEKWDKNMRKDYDDRDKGNTTANYRG